MTIPRLVVEKPDWERKKEEIEKAKREMEENMRWEEFMVGRGEKSRNMTVTEGQLGIDWSDASLASKDAMNVNITDLMRTDSATWASTTPCPVEAKTKEHTHSAETNNQQIAAGPDDITPITAALQTTPCPVGQVKNDVTFSPRRVQTVKVRGGRRGNGSEVMTVHNISDAFKKISAKNKILEQVSGKNGPGGSPKRKFDSKNSEVDSPNKRNKFNSTRHFWLNLEGAKPNKNSVSYENNTVGARIPLELGLDENLRGQCDDGIIWEQLED